MAEIAAGFIGAAIEVVKLVAKPITRQFSYLCCFTRNIDNLKVEDEKLDDAIQGLERQVEMGCKVENKFGMKILSEEEAWCLFREGAGTCVDDSKLNPIAKEVVKGCKGLPIALKTLGLALKDKSSASIWNDALRELRDGAADISDYIKKVYTPLIMSYNFLDSEMAKSLFLLCCLFPEDFDIPLERLTYFCMGLGIFEGIRNLEDARNKLSKLESFCEWKCDVELPSLTTLKIWNCPNMENFSMGMVATPNLKIVEIDEQEIDATKDLNDLLQQHYLAHQEKERIRRMKEEGGEEEQQQKMNEIEEEDHN